MHPMGPSSCATKVVDGGPSSVRGRWAGGPNGPNGDADDTSVGLFFLHDRWVSNGAAMSEGGERRPNPWQLMGQ